MGFLKNRMMEQEDHGYRMDGFGGYVCGTCVGDYALAEVVAANAESEDCDFCGAHADRAISADVDLVLQHMGDSIATEYDNAEGELPRDEGEFVGTTYDIHDVLESEEWEGQPDFQTLVEDAFSERVYCQRDPFALSEWEALHFGWRTFVETVIKEARFTFMVGPEIDDGDPGHPVLRGGAMLANLNGLIAEHNLHREIEAGCCWIRVRTVDKQRADYTTAEDLGAPPSHAAQPNRMSPAGIPMFYASDDEETAVREAVEAKEDSAERDAMVACFETTKAGLVVDLTDVPLTPSLFDGNNREKRAALGFLNGFARDVSRPLSPEDKQQTEYVPTQIVCEYLRHHHEAADGTRPLGLMFRSAKDRGIVNIVYFVGPEDCLDPDADADENRFQVRLKEARRRVL